MKESVFDVLIYLFDNYFDEYQEASTDQNSLKFELIRAGFTDCHVNKAFDWLEGLAQQKDFIKSGDLDKNNAVRIFNQKEIDKLDTDCRGFLLFLEQIGVLDANDREVAIDRIMALDVDEIDLEQLKWVILMVLLNQPGKEAAYTWMEDIYLDGPVSGLH